MGTSAGVVVDLVEEAINVAALLNHVGEDGDGAVASFIGRVRNHSDGAPVHQLDYQAYGPMALSEMRRIAIEARDRFGLSAVTVIHRVGALLVGEAAVVVITTAPHRGAALDGCRQIIEAVKRDVPIWKREHVPGGARWVDGRCAVQADV
ncbi:MAG: molybdenum cofactor biosynthesis protein MoaE [Candidatus Dormibacteraeota bacterium]|uniref:Molybdenum cofactor biosynthesis protein MoaE n=1 Tax=Candidatus Aeolococcus gillhamiae TaxID=3127015 RepID=A0A2W5ZHE1_9BACT|nr:molybdenum cofactor biosynthesis protein MoaE [Candidatus Dormibacteraeota bacterium]PZR82445.1 MAG: hypothetical protein DLM65_03850 [Candidatus Dormibacter sp. RRmetagenome_bin12]